MTQEDCERLLRACRIAQSGAWPTVPQHPLSSLIMCECGKSKLLATTVRSNKFYDEPRWEYRCRRRLDFPEAMRGCGRNNIDARVLESAVFVARCPVEM